MGMRDTGPGVGYTKHYDETLNAGIYGTAVPNHNFIYEVSSTQNPDFAVGDAVVLPGRRVFRYCLSTGQCDTFIGNVFSGPIGTGASTVGIDWSAVPTSAVVGDTAVVMTAPSTRVIAKDELRGGLITLNVSDGTNNDTMQMRIVVGNTACAASGTTTIDLDAPLVTALTGGTAYAYCYVSPYNAVQGAQINQSGKRSFVGYAAAPVSTSGLYHWEQTRGPISASLYGDVGKTQYFREVVFRFDGNLIHRGATGATGLEAQTAGYIMDDNNADNGATVVMLKLE